MVEIFVLALFAATSVSALTESWIRYAFFSRKIAIRVETDCWKDGRYVSWEEGLLALPGAYVSCVPMVYNEGAACYVRVRIDLCSEKHAVYPLTLSQVDGMGEEWIFQDGYFYYRGVLGENERIVLFDGIRIPENWTSWEESGISWNVSIDAEAIQAEHFAPDFQSEDPWGVQTDSLSILDAGEEEVVSVWDCAEGDFEFTVVSRLDEVEIGMEEQMISLGSFLPGTSKRTSVEVYNSSWKDKEILLAMQAFGDSAFTERMQVSICWSDASGEKILFEGALGACDGIEEVISLARHGEGRVYLTCFLPCESDNGCAAGESSLQLMLTDPSTGSIHWEENVVMPTQVLAGQLGTDVKTGDDLSVKRWILLLAGSGLLLGISCRKWRGMEEEADG